MDLSVIAPCLNEEKNLPELVSRILNTFDKRGINGEVILINDGSVDGTGAVIDELAGRDERVHSLHQRLTMGIAEAWRAGIAQASGLFVCFIAADLQNLPEDIWRLYREIRTTKSDIIQGRRSSIGRVKNGRYILSRSLNLLLNILFGIRQFGPTDNYNKSEFIIATKHIMEELLHPRYRYRHYHAFITLAARSRGYSIRQIETLYQSRRWGMSHIPRFPVHYILETLRDTVKALLEFRFMDSGDRILHQFLSQNPPFVPAERRSWLRRLYFETYIATMPLHAWMIDRNVKAYYDDYRTSQWLSQEKMRELQALKLRRLIWHAYHHVPFYRARMEEDGVSPDDFRTIEDLQKLPVLTKEDVRENLYFDIMADNFNPRKVLKITTSGSTGEPFVIFADKHQLEMRWAATLRSQEWTGYRFGDRCVRLWHQTLGMSKLQIIRELIDSWFNRRLFVPAFEMAESNIERSFNKVIRHHPVLLDGYAESLNFLAHYLKRKGLKGLKLKGVISSAQTLPAQSRQIIEEAFDTRVHDKYGSREFSGIAYQCDQRDGYHVVGECYIVEILKDGRPAAPGETGEVTVTDLNNYCLPLIRYKLGDLAVAMDDTPCPCGRGLLRIGRIEGRVQSIIVGTGRQYVPGTFFAHLIKDYDFAIRQFQIVQDRLGEITFKVIKSPGFQQEVLDEILGHFHQHLGEDMKIHVEFVDSIPMVRTGKILNCIQKLKIDFQSGEIS